MEPGLRVGALSSERSGGCAFRSVAPQAVGGASGQAVGVQRNLVFDDAEGVLQLGQLRTYRGLVLAQDAKPLLHGGRPLAGEFRVAADERQRHARRAELRTNEEPSDIRLGEQSSTSNVPSHRREEEGFSYYHAAKWGIEGFCEAIAPELAHFGIGITIAEPGATPTGFSAGLDRAPVMAEYDAGPVGDVRRAITSGAFRITNDPIAIAEAIIASLDVSPAPLRLPLGDDTYRDVRAAYIARLDHLDASRDIALSVAGA
jgi:NAD(P)-dependent dehydrogenase (short-subunit alcohol dehydrogenase family)